MTGTSEKVLSIFQFADRNDWRVELLERSPEAMCVVQVVTDSTGKPVDLCFVYANPEFLSLYHLNSATIKGESVYKLLSRAGRQWIELLYQSAFRGTVAKSKAFSHQLGQYISIKHFQIVEGYCGCIVKNVSAFREEKLESIRIQRKLDVILSKSADLVFDFDLATRTLQCGLIGSSLQNLSEKIQNVPGTLVDRNIIKSEGAAAAEAMLQQLQMGAGTASCELEVRADGDKPFQWYRCTLLAYEEEDTERLCIVGYLKDIHTEIMQSRELQRKADCDRLTGILNAGAGRQAVIGHLKDTQHGEGLCAMLMFDLDDFKSINDEYGHLMGDSVLQSFAKLLEEVFFENAVVYRLGGDEFAVFLPSVGLEQRICGLCESFTQQVCEQMRNQCRVSVSIGVAISARSRELDYDELYAFTDRVLYHVKKTGKNGFRVAHM